MGPMFDPQPYTELQKVPGPKPGDHCGLLVLRSKISGAAAALRARTLHLRGAAGEPKVPAHQQ